MPAGAVLTGASPSSGADATSGTRGLLQGRRHLAMLGAAIVVAFDLSERSAVLGCCLACYSCVLCAAGDVCAASECS